MGGVGWGCVHVPSTCTRCYGTHGWGGGVGLCSRSFNVDAHAMDATVLMDGVVGWGCVHVPSTCPATPTKQTPSTKQKTTVQTTPTRKQTPSTDQKTTVQADPRPYKANPINRTEDNSFNNSYDLKSKPHQQTRKDRSLTSFQTVHTHRHTQRKLGLNSMPATPQNVQALLKVD